MSKMPMMQDPGGLSLARKRDPLAREPEKPDIDRIRRERRRLETTLRQLDRRIMDQRQQARRAGVTPNLTDDLLRRDELGDQLLRTGTALRDERQQTTPDEVMAKRADLQRQGLQQARGDLSRASAAPSPDRVSQVRQATEAQAVAAARARQQPGGNVPANELLPSNLNRAAATTLAREQGAAIDSAARRVQGFEGFGFTPEQAAARAEEANMLARRRNLERTDAQADLARTFAERDAEEADARALAERVREAEEAQRIAEIKARTRAFDAVGTTPEPSAMEALNESLMREKVRAARIENDAGEVLLRRDGLGAASGNPTDPGAIGLERDRRAATEQGSVLLDNEREAIVADAVLAIADANNLTTRTDVSERKVSKIKDAMRRVDQLPQPLQGIVAGDIVRQLEELGQDEPFEWWGPIAPWAAGLGTIKNAVASGFTDSVSLEETLPARERPRIEFEMAMTRLRDYARRAPTQLPAVAAE